MHFADVSATHVTAVQRRLADGLGWSNAAHATCNVSEGVLKKLNDQKLNLFLIVVLVFFCT